MKRFNVEKDFAIGADISWVPQMEAAGFVFRNKAGKEQDVLLTLKDYGMDTIRLRTWVNPSDNSHSGHCSAEETVAFAKRCKKMGCRIMLNFHYSDSWADPKQQRIPAAWEDLSFDKLVKKMYDYTFEVITLFEQNNVELEWVQIGNETNPGMLIPMGSTDNFENLCKLYNSGHDAVKAVSPQTITMVHLAEINRTDFCINYIENLEKFNCRYDMLGFSVYPYWAHKESGMSYEECLTGYKKSMFEIPKRFNKDIMLVETGGVDEDEEGTAKLFEDLLDVMAQQPKCKGILLWEPQGAKVWSRYTLSAWRADGIPSDALNVLCNIKKQTFEPEGDL